MPQPANMPDAVELRRVLDETGWNYTVTGQRFGVSRTTVRGWVRAQEWTKPGGSSGTGAEVAVEPPPSVRLEQPEAWVEPRPVFTGRADIPAADLRSSPARRVDPLAGRADRSAHLPPAWAFWIGVALFVLIVLWIHM